MENIEHTTLRKELQALNDLLIRERIAITNMQMDLLGEIQQNKTSLLLHIQQLDEPADHECRELAKQVQANNKRNGWLLRSGLKLIARMKTLTQRKLAVTYTAHGRSLNIDTGPKIIARRL
jgi:flagellar biosynthesis/type III secretory pathway chaperone